MQEGQPDLPSHDNGVARVLLPCVVSREDARDAFDAADVNKSKGLDLMEVRDALKLRGYACTEEEVSALYRCVSGTHEAHVDCVGAISGSF